MSSDDIDDLDDIIDPRKAELEARFRELEYEAEIERLREQGGGGPAPRPGAEPGGAPPDAEPGPDPGVEDPLSDLKAAVDGSREVERYLLVVCPGCGARNRMSLTRVRTANPICGGCKGDLAVIR
jgi:hypothetical protein